MWKKVAAAVLLGAIALIAARVFWGGYHHHANHRSMQLQAQLNHLADALEHYRTDNGALPGALSELVSAGSRNLGPYAKPQLLIDPWGVPLFYRPSSAQHAFVVFSLGEDGVLGGGGNNQDRQALDPGNGD